MSSSRSSRRPPSTAVLQQFATSSSSSYRSSSNNSVQKQNTPPMSGNSHNDNTSATTNESASWSSRSGHYYSIFPRSHPHNNPSQSPSSFTSPTTTTPPPQQQPSYSSSNYPQQNYRTTGQQPSHQYQTQYYSPGQSSGRAAYRDDYSRSQHSVEDDWTNSQQQQHPAAQTPHNNDTISFETPPSRQQQSKQQQQQPPPVSDPGVRTRDQNRFAAYVNRFATVDPRMDYSPSIPSPHQSPLRPRFEEKKDDAARYSVSHKYDHHHHRPPSNGEFPRFDHADALDDYPDPDFGLEEMQAAEHAHRRSPPPPSMIGSVATTTALHSPGAYRTRNLARRFEGGTTSTKHAAPSWHRDWQEERGRPSRSRTPTPSGIIPPLDTAEEDYRNRSEIETPGPARVKALKEKLWDASESLQGKVRPSGTPLNPSSSFRSARSLSPKTSRRVYQHFGRPEDVAAVATAAAVEAAAANPSAAPRGISHPTHFEWTETRRAPTDDERSRSSYRDDRSQRDDRSYHTATRDDRSNQGRDDRSQHTAGRDDRSRSSSHLGESRRWEAGRSLSNPRPMVSAPSSSPPGDPYEGSGGELQNSPFFKSRYYEAAEKTVDRRSERSGPPSLSVANSSSSLEKGAAAHQAAATPSAISRQESMTPSRFFERQLEMPSGEPIEGSSDIQPSSSSVGSGARRVLQNQYPSRANSAVGASSYASTPIINNQQDTVASLLVKLQSVNRADPQAALREIDAILKAETGSAGQSRHASVPSASPPPAPAASPPPPPANTPPKEEGDDDDDEDSETETTVSSITNPTFSGQQSRRHKRREEKRQPTLPTTKEGEVTHSRKPLKEASDDGRRKKVRSPPPDTIQVSGARDRAGREHKSSHTRHVDLDELKDKVQYDSAAELAEKIRRWDELSGKGSAPEMKTPDIMSDTTDALGSIVTPSDGLPKKKFHPWDGSIPARHGKIDVRNTSMDNATGIEAQYSSGSSRKRIVRETVRERRRDDDERNNPFADESHNPFAQESDHESSHANRSRDDSRGVYPSMPQKTVMNMSNEFDDAWVTLPTSSFFNAKTPLRRTTDRQDEEGAPRDESPPPPPVSAKSASVQKFSPKRLESTKRDIDYNPSSTRPAVQEDEGPSVYDEKRFDQPQSEDEYEDGIEVTLVGTKKETKKKGLRALLQRRNSKPNLTAGAASVVSSNSRRRAQQNHMGAYEVEANPPRSSSRGRGRNRFVSPSRDRAHSLEERHVRNPNIARKFSRLLRVYNDEDRMPAEC